MNPSADPVLEKRARIARINSIALRVGAGLFVLATILFFLALLTEFTPFFATTITLCLLLGSAVLAPAMVFHYALKAADRADREDSW